MTDSNASIKQPNVLWIGVDQMRADALCCNSNPICQTPSLDQLARDGINFSRAYSPTSLCTPARASMLTGLYAFNHGMGTNCDLYHSMARELPRPEQLLHYQLQELGYRCGFTGKWHVGTELGPADYGFEGLNVPGYGDLRQEPEFQQYLAENNLSYGPINNPIFGNPGQKTLLAGEWNGSLESTPTYFLTNYSLDLLDRFAETYHQGGQPFFLTCQYWAPHPPYLPSPEYVGRHARQSIPEWINFRDDFHGKPRSLGRFRRDFYQALPDQWADWQEIVGLAYDFTTLVDEQIGRLLARLDELGLSDDTIVIFTGDHGDMVGSHGGLFDKGFMYEEAHRVPLIIRYPAFAAGGTVRDELVYNMDLMPTVFDLIGHDLGDRVNGQSLKPFLTSEQIPGSGRDAISLEFHGIRCLHTQRALISRDGFKYIFNPVDEDEFYDLNKDPGELHNLIEESAYREEIKTMQRLLIEAADRAGDPVQNYAAKLFGDYSLLADQPDVSAAYIHKN